MPKITGVHYDGDEITQFQLDNSQVVDYNTAIVLASAGNLPGYVIGAARNGRAVLRGVADGSPENNLSNLKRF